MKLYEKSRQSADAGARRAALQAALHLGTLFCLLAGLSERFLQGSMGWHWLAAALPMAILAAWLAWRHAQAAAAGSEGEAMTAQGCGACGGVYDNRLGVFGAGYMELGYQREMSRACRRQAAMSLLSVSFDYARMGGEHGRAAAEQSVSALAQILRASLRGSDVICHYEPGEFVVLLPETDKTLAGTPALRIQKATRQWRMESRQPAPSTIRIGVGDCWDGLSAALRQARTNPLQGMEMAALLQTAPMNQRPQA